MQKPGIPAQQMQRTGTREQASEDWLQGAGRTVRRFAAPAGRACPDPSARCAGRRRSSATARWSWNNQPTKAGSQSVISKLLPVEHMVHNQSIPLYLIL